MLLFALSATAAYKFPTLSTRREAMKATAAAVLVTHSVDMVSAIEARPTFIEARQDGKEDREAARLLKQVSFEELVMKSKANKEAEVREPKQIHETAPITRNLLCAVSRSLDGSSLRKSSTR